LVTVQVPVILPEQLVCVTNNACEVAFGFFCCCFLFCFIYLFIFYKRLMFVNTTALEFSLGGLQAGRDMLGKALLIIQLMSS
jgi:hypothetical protein